MRITRQKTCNICIRRLREQIKHNVYDMMKPKNAGKAVGQKRHDKSSIEYITNYKAFR